MSRTTSLENHLRTARESRQRHREAQDRANNRVQDLKRQQADYLGQKGAAFNRLRRAGQLAGPPPPPPDPRGLNVGGGQFVERNDKNERWKKDIKNDSTRMAQNRNLMQEAALMDKNGKVYGTGVIHDPYSLEKRGIDLGPGGYMGAAGFLSANGTHFQRKFGGKVEELKPGQLVDRQYKDAAGNKLGVAGGARKSANPAIEAKPNQGAGGGGEGKLVHVPHYEKPNGQQVRSYDYVQRPRMRRGGA